MPAVSVSPVVRAILTADNTLSADEVIKRAKAKGVTAPDSNIRDTVYNIKSELRKKAAKPAPAAARETKAPAAPAAVAVAPSDLASILANVAQVDTAVGACGGVDHARQVAEAVRACGSVDAFLQHLELVAKMRGGSAK
jgi:hypothetical protein